MSTLTSFWASFTADLSTGARALSRRLASGEETLMRELFLSAGVPIAPFLGHPCDLLSCPRWGRCRLTRRIH